MPGQLRMKQVIQQHLNDRAHRIDGWDDPAIVVECDVPVPLLVDQTQPVHDGDIVVVHAFVNHRHPAQMHHIGVYMVNQNIHVREDSLKAWIGPELGERGEVGFLVLQNSFEFAFSGSHHVVWLPGSSTGLASETRRENPSQYTTAHGLNRRSHDTTASGRHRKVGRA